MLTAILKVLGRDNLSSQADCACPANGTVGRRGLRILLAEDNRVNQAVACRMVEKMGHSIVVANNGNEALSLLAQQSFDLVLMDIQMPEMDGLTATRKIRESEMRASLGIPIIAMTAHAMTGDRERCLHAGMDGYISKPINSQELERAIAAVIPGGDTILTLRSRVPGPASATTWDIAAGIEADWAATNNFSMKWWRFFLPRAPQQIASLRRAMAEEDTRRH